MAMAAMVTTMTDTTMVTTDRSGNVSSALPRVGVLVTYCDVTGGEEGVSGE